MNCASSPLPTPLSPVSRILKSVADTYHASSSTSTIAPHCPSSVSGGRFTMAILPQGSSSQALRSFYLEVTNFRREGPVLSRVFWVFGKNSETAHRRDHGRLVRNESTTPLQSFVVPGGGSRISAPHHDSPSS